MKNEAGKEVPVKRLFHGVESEYINAICHGNVDWAVSGLNDTRFGKGEFGGRSVPITYILPS